MSRIQFKRYCLILLSFVFVLSSAQASPQKSISSEDKTLLEKIVNINTDGSNYRGLNSVRDILVQEFQKVGMTPSIYDVGNNHKVIAFEWKNIKPTILLLGHIDTVFPPDSQFQKLTDAGDKLIGPGVIDMKGGVVLMLSVLRDLAKEGLYPPVRVVINDDEESGSSNSKATLRSLTSHLQYGLVLEPGLEDGSVVTGQAGVRWLKLTVAGKAAHAGLNPLDGISACAELAEKISRIARLSHYDRGLFVNPGVIAGGTKPNVICENASVMIDIRFQNGQDLINTEKEIKKIASTSYLYNQSRHIGTTATVETLAQMPLMPESQARYLKTLSRQLAKKEGWTLDAKTVGYGSDANNVANGKIKLLIGLGPYGGGMHTESEFMKKESYPQRRALVKDLLRQLSQHEAQHE